MPVSHSAITTCRLAPKPDDSPGDLKAVNLSQHVADDVADGKDDYLGWQDDRETAQELKGECQQLNRLYCDDIGGNQYGNE